MINRTCFRCFCVCVEFVKLILIKVEEIYILSISCFQAQICSNVCLCPVFIFISYWLKQFLTKQSLFNELMFPPRVLVWLKFQSKRWRRILYTYIPYLLCKCVAVCLYVHFTLLEITNFSFHCFLRQIGTYGVLLTITKCKPVC